MSTRLHENNPALSVTCPKCNAGPNEPCKTGKGGVGMSRLHRNRVIEYRRDK